MRNGKASNGFTLVELLVVIGIIALLISVLLPVLGKAQESAKQIKCCANLRQIQQAFTLYASEYQGTVVPSYVNVSGGSPASFGDNNNRWEMMLYRYGYFGNRQDMDYQYYNIDGTDSNPANNTRPARLLCCPKTNFIYSQNRLVGGDAELYADNYHHCFPIDLNFGVKIKLNQIKDASRVINIGEPSSTWPSYLYRTRLWMNPTEIGAPHNQMTNFSCFDGHVESARVQDLITMVVENANYGSFPNFNINNLGNDRVKWGLREQIYYYQP